MNACDSPSPVGSSRSVGSRPLGWLDRLEPGDGLTIDGSRHGVTRPTSPRELNDGLASNTPPPPRVWTDRHRFTFHATLNLAPLQAVRPQTVSSIDPHAGEIDREPQLRLKRDMERMRQGGAPSGRGPGRSRLADGRTRPTTASGLSRRDGRILADLV